MKLPSLLLRRTRSTRAPAPDGLTLRLDDGVVVPVSVRRSARARRLTLRLDRRDGGLKVSAPPFVPAREIEDFLHRQRDWVADRRRALPARRPFEPGARVPVLGVDRMIVHLPDSQRPARLEADRITVGGDLAHLPRRVEDCLKRVARREYEARAQEKAARLGRPFSAIRVRDTRSRWGSCSATGVLSFSWRLVLAPPSVLDYLVAHEVAHLAEMNHGPRFWATAARLCEGMEESRAWLRRHGADLHLHG